MVPSQLEERVTRLEERLGATDGQIRVFAPTVRQVIEATLKLEAVTEDLRDFKQALGDVERRLENQIRAVADGFGQFQKDYQSDKTARAIEEKERGRVRWQQVGVIFAAIITSSGAIIAAIITGIH